MGLITSSGGGVSLQTLGLGLVLLQLIVTVALPIIQYFFFYNLSASFLVVPIVTWCLTGVAGVVGIAAFATKKGLLLALHIGLTLAGSALNGGFNTQFFLDIRFRCRVPMGGGSGCSACACAATETCKQSAFEAGGACASCNAFGTDVCAEGNTLMSLLPWMGLIQAVMMALPVMASACLLARVEAEASAVLREMTRAKLCVAEDLARHESNQSPLTPAAQLAEFVRMVARYGSYYDRQLAARAARAWGVEIGDIMRPVKPATSWLGPRVKKAPKQVVPITIKVGDGTVDAHGHPIDMPPSPGKAPSGSGKGGPKKKAKPAAGPGAARQLNVGPR